MIKSDTWLMLFDKFSSHSRVEFQRSFRIQGSTVLWMFFVLLVVAVLGVTLLLPDYVDAVTAHKNSKQTAKQITPSNTELTNELLKPQLNKKITETAQQNIDTARQQFTLALSIAHNDKRAKSGMDRVSTLEKASAKLNSGRRNEEKGQLKNAQADYQTALTLDPDNAKAGKLLVKVKQKIASEKYHHAMTEGYLFLDENKYAKAKHSFNQAKAINPSSTEVWDALELVKEEYKLSRIRLYKTQAEELENNEQWHDAVKTYQAALKLDNTLKFALEGKNKSQFYAQVNDDMDYIIQHSYRLASDQPYNSAVSLLKKVENIQQKGERLKTKLSVLDKLVKLARILVPITLESDGLTDIMVYKVGKLGRFSMRKLNLYPGKYTAVGSCPGYQDIRKEFSVLANQPKAYFIRCEEVI